MTKFKAILGLLMAVLVVVGGVAFGAPQASATRGPIVIPYEKMCVSGVCDGTAGHDGTIHMQITGFQPTNWGAKVTFTESIEVGQISFTAEMKGRLFGQAAIIVLSGRVTEGSFEGARVLQMSKRVGPEGPEEEWTGKLLLLPANR
jgi:hypothetical protein